MGYYTRYELKLHDNPRKRSIEAIMRQFRVVCESAEYCLTEDGSSEDSSKWYDHTSDLCALSRDYPEVVFKMTGAGEEAGDMWHLYVKNGRHQLCPGKITFDSYDESKLQ